MLTRLLDEGWLADGWEDPPTIHGRPPRRYYQITDLGLARLGALVAEASRDARFSSLNLNPGLYRLPLGVLIIGLTCGLAPGLVLILMVLLYPKDHPRRRELVGELRAIPYFHRALRVSRRWN